MTRHVSAPCAIAVIAALVAGTLFAAPAASADLGNSVVFGAYVPSTANHNHAATYSEFENTLGRSVAIDRTYSLWSDVQPTSALLDDKARGRLPLLSIRPQLSNGTKISWAGIAAGEHDAEITAQAAALRDFAAPVLLAFHHEAEIASGYGSATDFVAAFRHYVTVFRAAGAANVRFVVIFVPVTFAGPTADAWYPGDSYVDWIGTDAYNWNNCKVNTSGWRSLAQAAQAFYLWGSARGKPLVLAEWGSVEDPTQPDRKAQWITDALTTMSQWPALQAAAYFDSYGNCDWRLSSSASALDAFVTAAHSVAANRGPSATLLGAPGTAPAPLTATFDASGSTGSMSSTGSGATSYSFDPGDGSSTIQGSGQPGALTFRYATAGTFTARLTITDATGASATTTAAIHAAATPAITEGNPAVTSTTAQLPAWIDPDGLAATYFFQWGLTTGLGWSTAPASLPAVDYFTAVTGSVTGLAPHTRYYWRAAATSAAGTTYGPVRYFTTTN